MDIQRICPIFISLSLSHNIYFQYLYYFDSSNADLCQCYLLIDCFLILIIWTYFLRPLKILTYLTLITPRNWRDQTVVKVLSLHAAHLKSIPGIIYTIPQNPSHHHEWALHTEPLTSLEYCCVLSQQLDPHSHWWLFNSLISQIENNFSWEMSTSSNFSELVNSNTGRQTHAFPVAFRVYTLNLVLLCLSVFKITLLYHKLHGEWSFTQIFDVQSHRRHFIKELQHLIKLLSFSAWKTKIIGANEKTRCFRLSFLPSLILQQFQAFSPKSRDILQYFTCH